MLRTYIDVLDFFYWYLVFRGPPNGVSRCQICQDVVAEFFQSKWVSRFNHESQSELVLHSLGKNIDFRAGFGTMILKWEISYEMNCIIRISLVFLEKHIYIHVLILITHMLKGMTTFGETYAHDFDTTVNFSESFDSTSEVAKTILSAKRPENTAAALRWVAEARGCWYVMIGTGLQPATASTRPFFFVNNTYR